MPPLKVIFMGTPGFAVPALEALIKEGHHIARVYTQPPRPAGRGQREQRSAVHSAARDHDIEVRTTLQDDTTPADFSACDVAVVAAYGLLLPPSLLAAPKRGCLNIHASLLPRWRGAAPIQRAILAGDRETGVTIMQMDEGLDTGDILLTGKVAIDERTTATQLHDELSRLGARLIVEALSGQPLEPRPQPTKGVTLAPRLKREEGRMDWSQPAHMLDRQVRALNPWPGTWCHHASNRLRILEARAAAGSGVPGTVIEAPLTVACGSDALVLDRVQRPGKSALSATDFIRGNPLPLGTVLE